MNFQTPQVLRSRRNVLREWSHKEWWYTGFYLPQFDVYFSFFFARVHLVDDFSITLFDPKRKAPFHFNRKMWLSNHSTDSYLHLSYEQKQFQWSLEGDPQKGWHFRCRTPDIVVDLHFEEQMPAFTKFEDNGITWHGLVHYFGLACRGFMELNGQRLVADGAWAYSDHSFGCVPKTCRWHWVEAQNEQVAIASLVNYGADGQRYTQIYFKEGDANIVERWIRLSADVTFEILPQFNSLDVVWAITSPDMELFARPRQEYCEHIKVPSVLPFMVNVLHREVFVEVWGRVRIDKNWFEISHLYGVVEAHFGYW